MVRVYDGRVEGRLRWLALPIMLRTLELLLALSERISSSSTLGTLDLLSLFSRI
jgi:hypothetical protein